MPIRGGLAPAQVPVPFILANLAIFAVIVDSLVYLFKKYHNGNWMTRLQDLDAETRVTARFCCFLCVPPSLLLTTLTFFACGLQDMLIAAISVFAAHFAYRLPMTISDKGASRYVSRIRRKIQQQKKIRRCLSILSAGFAFCVAVMVAFLLRDKILSSFF